MLSVGERDKFSMDGIAHLWTYRKFKLLIMIRAKIESFSSFHAVGQFSFQILGEGRSLASLTWKNLNHAILELLF